jgi:endonuclease I
VSWCFLSCLLLVLASPASAQSEPPIHYYDAAIGKTGSVLKSALQSIIRGQTVIPYDSAGTDTWAALKILDQDPANSNNVILIYSGFSVPKSDQYNGTTGTWEREHLWPQSYGLTALNSNSQAKRDLFNLRPIDLGVNSSRGNKYYDISTPPVSTYPGAPGSTYDADSWEPRDVEKGPIARAMFYMAVRYDGSDADVPDLELSDTPNAAQYRFGKLSTLLAWHRQFGVDASEQERNQRIYSDYQHNRNPFVDYPEYAEMVFDGVTPGEAWKDTHFTAAELNDPNIGGDLADPDGDGLPNLLEYVFNHDPWKPDNSSVTTVTVTSQGATHYLYVTYPHNRNATDVSVSYEGSTDLHTWVSTQAQLISAIATSSETEQVTVRISTTAPAYFVGIRATRIQ